MKTLRFKSFVEFANWYVEKNSKNLYAVALLGPVALVHVLYQSKQISKQRLFNQIKERALQPVYEIRLTNKPINKDDIAFYIID